jgi:hypothetical protein
MSQGQIVLSTVLALIGFGIMAGQSFKVNGWVCFFWGLAIAVGLYGLFTPAAKTNDLSSSSSSKLPQSTVVAQPQTDRIKTAITPEELARIHIENTSVQAQRLLSPYVGKWIEIKEPVKDVSDTSIFVSHPMEGRILGAPIRLNFHKSKWQDSLDLLRKGDVIHALCRINKVDSIVLDLDQCELIKP